MTTTTDNAAGARLPVAEEFYSLQGEGFHAGMPAYFVRLAGCDLRCPFCDTRMSWDAAAFPLHSAEAIAGRAAAAGARNVVVTGGEPAMHPLAGLAAALRAAGMATFLETSGAYPVEGVWDWICVSPKRQRPPLPGVLARADELKVVVAGPDDLPWALQWAPMVRAACRLSVQPEASRFESAAALAVDFAKRNPAWRVSLQTHKFMRIP